jgi:AraC-like DNA-binding protein
MTGTPLAGTDLSREILGEVLDERGKPGSNPQEPATTLAEKVQAAIDQGASLDELRRHFHLSESELRDYCSDIMDDGAADPGRNSSTGY